MGNPELLNKIIREVTSIQLSFFVWWLHEESQLYVIRSKIRVLDCPQPLLLL